MLKYHDIEEVIARARDPQFGLAGSVWGRGLVRATDVAMRIDSGTTWVNQHLAMDATIPFRGAKQSGFGAELCLDGLHEYRHAHIINVVPLSY